MTPTLPAAAALQADALVDLIERQAAAQRQALLDEAAREAEAIRQRARAKARRQQQRALDEMRSSQRQRTQQLLAELETAARQRSQAQAVVLLARAWPRLCAAIDARWRDPGARRQWLQAQLAEAQARLPAQGWVLRHPAAWDDAERSSLQAMLQPHGAADATLQADPSISAGLVIEAGGARLDSRPEALLADRARAEAALLAGLQLTPAPTPTAEAGA